MICVYLIKNIINKKCYIGSTKNFNVRKLRHIQTLKNNYHHNIHLQRSFNKHGLKSFIFEILEQCKEDQLFEKEQFWINKLKPEYNIGAVGGGDNYTNHPNKEKLRFVLLKGLEKARAAPKPDITKDKNPNWRGGKTFYNCPICNKETRTTGDKYKPKTCMKCRNRDAEKNPFFGKSHSDKTRKLLRDQRVGIPNLHSSKKCVIEGILYNSCIEAAKSLNIKQKTMSARLRSKSKKFTNYYYVGSKKDPNSENS